MPVAPRVPARRTVAVPDPDPSGDQAAAIRELVAEVKGWREEFAKAVETFTPAAEAVGALGEAQEKLCRFIVNNRLKLVGGMIGAALAVGAVTPAAADRLMALLKGFGL